MQIKISRTQWETIGKTAGWIRTAERLFIIPQLDGKFQLQDARRAKLATFPSAEEAAKWAKDNGYEVQFQQAQTPKTKTAAKEPGSTDGSKKPIIVFENKNGFITDLGPELELRTTTGELVDIAPRYGVWMYDQSKRKHQVQFTTNDLEQAKAKLTVAPKHPTKEEIVRQLQRMKDNIEKDPDGLFKDPDAIYIIEYTEDATSWPRKKAGEQDIVTREAYYARKGTGDQFRIVGRTTFQEIRDVLKNRNAKISSTGTRMEKVASQEVPANFLKLYMSTQNDPRQAGVQGPYIQTLIANKRSAPIPLERYYGQADVMAIVNDLNKSKRGAGMQASQIFG